jgi:hypothetical protein
MKQQRRFCSAEKKPNSSLETISCQQRATLEKRNEKVPLLPLEIPRPNRDWSGGVSCAPPRSTFAERLLAPGERWLA